MKFCLVAAQKADIKDLDIIGVSSFKNTYKTVDGFVLDTEIIRNGETTYLYQVSFYNDLANIIDLKVLENYAKKYGMKSYKEVEDLDSEFLDLFNPNVSFVKNDFILDSADFFDLEKQLLTIEDSYKEVIFPLSIRDYVEKFYLEHKSALQSNMCYNIDVSCALSKIVLSGLTSEAVYRAKKEMLSVSAKETEVLVESDIKQPTSSLTLRMFIKKD